MANEPAAPSAGGSPHAHGSAASESIAKRADRTDHSLIQSLQKIQRIHGFRNKSETTWDVLDMPTQWMLALAELDEFQAGHLAAGVRASTTDIDRSAWKLMETAGPLRTSDFKP